AEDGEEAFRAMEREACRTLGRDGGLVIATGGGAVLNADNVTSLAENGTIVWLTVTADTVIARLAGDTTRPLLQRDDKEAAIAELLAARDPLYRRAAAVIVDAARDPRDVVESILAAPSFS
ncbi:MAG: shikimate kinase, partial [Clostridia bacterium]|nr:shikimate kinase [Clostridia bacterium]